MIHNIIYSIGRNSIGNGGEIIPSVSGEKPLEDIFFKLKSCYSPDK